MTAHPLVLLAQRRSAVPTPTLPADLRDSLAATTEPIARRVLLERLVAGYPRDPLVHAELAASLLRHPLIRLGWGGGNEPATDRARDELQAALRADPAYTPAALALADYALRSNDARDLTLARAALSELVQLKPNDSDAWLARTRVAAELGDAPGTLEAAQRAAALPGDAGRAQRTAGVALMQQPQTEAQGAALYLDALQRASAETQGACLDDIRYLLPDSVFHAWQAVPRGLTDSIQGFWRRHAAVAGVSVAERMAVHFRRARAALQEYAVAERGQKWAPPPSALLQTSDLDREFDDRGLVFLKHGRPTHVVAAHSPRVDPNETWFYDLLDGSREVFHFVATRNASGFRLVKNPLEMIPDYQHILLRVGPLAVLDTMSLRPELLDFLDDAGRYDHELQLLAENLRTARVETRAYRNVPPVRRPPSIGSSEGLRRQQDLLTRNEQHGLAMLSRETYVPPFGGDMPFAYALYQFRGEAGTHLVAALAVPAEHMEATPAPAGGIAYSFRASLNLADTIGGGTWRIDTAIAVHAPRELRPGDAIRVQLPLDVPALLLSTIRVTVRAGTGSEQRGQVYGGDLPMRAFPVAALALSDIVLAAARPGSWRRGDVALALNPSETFRADQAFPVFYEVYGLEPGEPYRTTLEVAPEAEGIRGAVGRGRTFTVRYQGQAAPDAATGIVQELRDVRPQLPPGRCRLRVTVNAEGSTASTERRVRLLERW